MNVTSEQKVILLNWMKVHPDVARGRLRQKGESKSKMKQLLEDLANKINMANKGPNKSSSEWFKTWKDWKMYVLKKETKRRSYQLGTGGGSPIKVDMSPLEEELLDFLTPEAAGLENIPQGGLNVHQRASYSQEDSYNLDDLDNVDNLDNLDEVQTQEPQSSNYLLPRKMLHTSNVDNLDEVQTQEAQSSNYLPPRKRLHTSNLDNLDEVQTQEPQSSNYLPPRKKLHTSNVVLNKESEIKSVSVEMVNLQKEKIQLKKEELSIRRQCLAVQRSAFSELREMRRAMETFISLQTNY